MNVCQYCGKKTKMRMTICWVPGMGNVKARLCQKHSREMIEKSRCYRGLDPKSGRRARLGAALTVLSLACSSPKFVGSPHPTPSVDGGGGGTREPAAGGSSGRSAIAGGPSGGLAGIPASLDAGEGGSDAGGEGGQPPTVDAGSGGASAGEAGTRAACPECGGDGGAEPVVGGAGGVSGAPSVGGVGGIPAGCPELTCGGECSPRLSPESCGSCGNVCPPEAECRSSATLGGIGCVCRGCRDAVGGCRASSSPSCAIGPCDLRCSE